MIAGNRTTARASSIIDYQEISAVSGLATLKVLYNWPNETKDKQRKQFPWP